jgi:exopolysaccharide production protein ExoY
MKNVELAVGGRAKRVFDIVVASLFTLVTIPLFIVIAMILKVTGPGPIICKKVRVGLGGRRFTCFKFRTMVVDSENIRQALLDDDPGAPAKWQQNQIFINDPRVARVGQILRESSLDELPALINVLRGEMSLIGPRPIAPSEMLRYGENIGSYVLARPGLTGAWQMTDQNDSSYDKLVELDANYVSNWRFSTDLTILMRTMGAVIDREGSN